MKLKERNVDEILRKALKRIDLSKKQKERVVKLSSWAQRKLEKGFNDISGVEIIVGGSLAKDTLLKATRDIDIFVRFPKSFSKFLEVFEIRCKKIFPNAELIRGSRNYFRIRKNGYLIEIIPTLKIEKPEDAENTMDLSIFHINYVKNSIERESKLRDEIKLFKAFLQAIDCYGAETYKHGFSGYASELLVINFKSFLNTLKELTSRKPKIFVDPGNHYKNFEDAKRNLSEAKIRSPIILIDPTFKGRNALASLSYDTFSRFVFEARKFLLHPSLKFFERRKIDKAILLRRSRKRGTKLYITELRRRKFGNEEIFFAKLEKELKRFRARAEREGFRIYDIGFVELEEKIIVFVELECLALSRKKIHLGPPVWVDDKFFRNFLEKWGINNVYVHRNRLAVDSNRRKFDELWKEFSRILKGLSESYLR